MPAPDAVKSLVERFERNHELVDELSPTGMTYGLSEEKIKIVEGG